MRQLTVCYSENRQQFAFYDLVRVLLVRKSIHADSLADVVDWLALAAATATTTSTEQ